MKRVCAWCGLDMGRVEGSKHPDSELSHGICERCVDNFTFQQGVTLREYIESIPVPVLVVDSDVVVQMSNAAARAALGKEAAEIVGRRGGNVFECAHARLPQGCGRTVHCSGCAIRRTVTRTYETGEASGSVPATLTRQTADRLSAAALAITTVKAGDIIILRVDSLA